MLDASQPWSLFGIDLGRAVHYVRSGWREFLWGNGSVVLSAVDELVLVHLESGESCCFRAGQRLPTPAGNGSYAEAVALPDDLALVKTLSFPLAVESELDAVLALEVGSSSPFPEADTCYGWRISKRSEDDIEVLLVISSRSAVMAYIAKEFDTHDMHAYEVWGVIGDDVVVLSGFGEDAREQRNRRRLGRMVAACSYCLLLLLVVGALAAGTKYMELQKVRDQQAAAAKSAVQVLQLRENLSTARRMIGVATGYLEQFPSPRAELARLSALLGDETWVSQIEVHGGSVKIEGQSSDASAVMQLLLGDPAYSEVDAPLAFTKQRSGAERFVLEMTLAKDGGRTE